MGTPDFAVPALESLIKAGHRIPLLVCQPDRKKGRGHRFQPPPTKSVAIDHGIEVFQPTSVRTDDVLDKIRSCQPDFCVAIAYGKILPKSILDLPQKACVNVHASLLPKWRGAAPIQFSLLNGDTKTGVSTMLMAEEMDTGDILQTAVTDIDPDERFDSLSNRLAKLGADLIVETIQRFDTIKPSPQNHSEATYARLLTKDDRLIQWEQTAVDIYNRFRALSPAPGVFTWFRGKRLVIKEMTVINDPIPGDEPGTLRIEDKSRLIAACGQDQISLLSCQPENKKQMSVADLINGYQIQPGERLGL